MVVAAESEIERRDAEAAFTVVEVVAALALLAAALGLLLNIISTSIRQTGRAETLAEAGSLGRSLLAKVGRDLPLHDGEITGEPQGAFRWRVIIEPYGDGAERREWPVAAHQISAEVTWVDGLQTRSVVLMTLRLGPNEETR